MLSTPDLYLGTFLVLSGFALSLLNLRRILKKSESTFSTVLLSENIFLMCIGAAFILRAVYGINPENINFESMQMGSRNAGNMKFAKQEEMSSNCDFKLVLMSYGPFIVSLINSFLSLIIDNYMHYKMMVKIKEKEDENVVQEIGEPFERKIKVNKLFWYLKKYFSFIAIAVQWIVPFLMVVSMYPVGIQEMMMPMSILRSTNDCMAMLNIKNVSCSYDNDDKNVSVDFRKYVSSSNYLEVYENEQINGNRSEKIDSVVNNVHNIISNLKNNSKYFNLNVTSPYSFRDSRKEDSCIKMCYLDNKRLLLYMFALVIVTYFAPITVSTIILTKIHLMEVKKTNMKIYVSRELLYNILFWTPVMLDTFVSLIMCSYSMNGPRTSLFNVVANIYQAVKNFMNTKYFKDNTVVPV